MALAFQMSHFLSWNKTAYSVGVWMVGSEHISGLNMYDLLYIIEAADVFVWLSMIWGQQYRCPVDCVGQYGAE